MSDERRDRADRGDRVDGVDEVDEVIARALRQLPVPDHGPTFWADLERRISDPIEPAAAHAAAAMAADPPVHRLDTSELPSVTALAERRSRRSRRAPVLAAAAAIIVLVVAVGVVASLATGDDDGGGDAELAATTTLLRPEPTTTAPGAATSNPAVLSTDTPSGAVTAWLRAVGSGDVAAASALTGPRSAAYASASMDGLEAYLTGEQANFAALAELPETAISVIPAAVFAGSGQTVSVVVIDAEDAGSAHDGPPIEVFPVVDAGDGWKVEPLALDPDIENRVIVQSPRAPSGSDGLGTMAADGAVEVIVPATGTVVFQVDDLEPFSRQTTGVGANDDPYARYDPPGALSNGLHTLVIVGVGEDGTIVSVAGPFTVTGGESTGTTRTTATTGPTRTTATTEP